MLYVAYSYQKNFDIAALVIFLFSEQLLTKIYLILVVLILFSLDY